MAISSQRRICVSFPLGFFVRCERPDTSPSGQVPALSLSVPQQLGASTALERVTPAVLTVLLAPCGLALLEIVFEPSS